MNKNEQQQQQQQLKQQQQLRRTEYKFPFHSKLTDLIKITNTAFWIYRLGTQIYISVVPFIFVS